MRRVCQLLVLLWTLAFAAAVAYVCDSVGETPKYTAAFYIGLGYAVYFIPVVLLTHLEMKYMWKEKHGADAKKSQEIPEDK